MKTIGIFLFFIPLMVQSSEQTPDLDFLEWLGQIPEVRELGVDIEQLLKAKERISDNEIDKAEYYNE